MDALLSQGRTLIDRAQRILVFSGAGLSTESGIPDFRSPGGIWSRYDPSDFYFHKIISDESAREAYWRMSSEYWLTMRDALPNPAHLAVKRLEEEGKIEAVVTQNIDHLHHKAGNSPERIIEIHGTAFTVSCLTCGKSYEREAIEAVLRSGVKAPYCEECGGILKPDTISFGQSMPMDKMERAMRIAAICDLCLVLGSSLVVHPAASIPEEALRRGARLVIVNRDPTHLDEQADLVIHESIGGVLQAMIGANAP